MTTPLWASTKNQRPHSPHRTRRRASPSPPETLATELISGRMLCLCRPSLEAISLIEFGVRPGNILTRSWKSVDDGYMALRVFISDSVQPLVLSVVEYHLWVVSVAWGRWPPSSLRSAHAGVVRRGTPAEAPQANPRVQARRRIPLVRMSERSPLVGPPSPPLRR